MTNICILTDSTAQFPTPAFPGRNLVNVISMQIKSNGSVYTHGNGIKASDISLTPGEEPPVVQTPSAEEFQAMFNSLGKHFSYIFTILHSSALSTTYMNAKKAAEVVQGHTDIIIIDGQTIATGLGLLVQSAAAAAENEMPIAEIERYIRRLVPRVYSIFCIEGLSYLENAGYLGPAQAIIGELIKVLPLFIFDGGQLVHTQKARNYRHLVDILHEFLNEFDNLKHIAFLQGVPPFETETRSLREHISDDFPETPISEHIISAPLASMIGPRSLGMFVMEQE